MTLTVGDSTLVLEGPVTLATLHAIQAEVHAHMGRGDWTVDWARVSDVDSVALALMFCWQRASRAAGRSVRHTNLPANLTALADLYGVSDLLDA